MKTRGNCGNLLTVADLKAAVAEIEDDLINSDKTVLSKLLKGLSRLTELLEKGEPDVYPIVVTWLRLYLKMQNAIEPSNDKLVKQYNGTIPTAISYIIGCLQYDPPDDSNFQYKLLEIMEELLQSSHPNVVKQCANFSSGTIACMWKPISVARDFNTQALALKAFSMMLKNLDADKQEGELKTIKWSNLNLFKSKLNKVIEETSQHCVHENACRELLNNYNMELKRNVLIYSVHCKYLVIGNKFELYKPLVVDKFWVDINFRPKTLSFRGRHKLENFKFQDIDVNLKWTNIQLESGCLLFTIEKIKDSKLPANMLSKLKRIDTVNIYVTDNEEQRIRNNKNAMNCMKETEFKWNIPDNDGTQFNKTALTPINLESENNCPETPCTSKGNNYKTNHYFLRQPTPNRKFFSYLEEDDEHFHKQKRKKSTNKRTRLLKPRTARKSVCKVTPVVVDLTRTPKFHNQPKEAPLLTMEDIKNTEDVAIAGQCCLSDNQCSTILEKVSNCINNQEPYDYHAETYKSHHNFKSRHALSDDSLKFENINPNRRTNTEKNYAGGVQIIEEPSDIYPISANVNKNETKVKYENNRKRKMLSQNVSEQVNDSNNLCAPANKMPRKGRIQNFNNFPVEQINIEDDCDVERFGSYINMCSTPVVSPESYPKTPTSTNAMNVSDIQLIDDTDHFLLMKTRTENETAKNNSWFGADNEVLKETLIGYQTLPELNNQVNDLMEEDTLIQHSALNGFVIYRQNSDIDSDSESEDINSSNSGLKVFKSMKPSNQQFITNFNFLKNDKFSNKELTGCNKQNVHIQSATVGDSESNSMKSPTSHVNKVHNTLSDIFLKPKSIAISLKKNEFDLKTRSHATSQTTTFIDPKAQHISSNGNVLLKELENDVGQNGQNIPGNHIKLSKSLKAPPEYITESEIEAICQNEAHCVESVLQDNDRIPVPANNIKFIPKPVIPVTTSSTNEDSLIEPRKSKIIPKTHCQSTHIRNNGSCRAIIATESIILNNHTTSSLIYKETHTQKDVMSCVQCFRKNLSQTTMSYRDVANEHESYKIGCNSRKIVQTIDRNEIGIYKNNKTVELLNSFCLNCTVQDTSNRVLRSNGNVNEESVSSQCLLRIDTEIGVQKENQSSNILDISNNLSEADDDIEQDVSHLKGDYLMKVGQVLNDTLPQSVGNTFNDTKYKICQLIGSIVRQSMEFKKELGQLYAAMQRLMRQMECQYEIYANKNKQFETFQKNTERIMNEYGGFILQSGIYNESQDVIDKFTVSEQDTCRKIWQTFFDLNKQNLLNKINSLSEI